VSGVNERGQLLKLDNIFNIDPKTQVVLMTYDAEGNLDLLTDPRGNIYDHDHDLLNRRTRLQYPNGSSERSTYDPASNLQMCRTTLTA